MAPYLWATLREALRSPVTWAVALAGGLAGWAGLALHVLALGSARDPGGEISGSTGQLVAVVLGLFWAARTLDQDRRGGFPDAADATAPGPAGRVLGRWAGAAVVGGLAGGLVSRTVGALADPGELNMWLYLTPMFVAAHACAMGALLGVRGGGVLTFAGGLVAWLLGHLPWGGPEFLPGTVGRGIRAVLPGPPDASEGLAFAGYTSAAVAGLLLLALASAPRSPSAD